MSLSAPSRPPRSCLPPGHISSCLVPEPSRVGPDDIHLNELVERVVFKPFTKVQGVAAGKNSPLFRALGYHYLRGIEPMNQRCCVGSDHKLCSLRCFEQEFGKVAKQIRVEGKLGFVEHQYWRQLRRKKHRS